MAHKISVNDPLLLSAGKGDYLVYSNPIEQLKIDYIYLITKKLTDGFEFISLGNPEEIKSRRFNELQNGFWYLIIIPASTRLLIGNPLR